MDSEIEGPLGFWTWPILNTLMKMNSDDNSSNDTSVETAKVIRDSNGEVQEVIVIKE